MATFIEEMQTATGNSHPGGHFPKDPPTPPPPPQKKMERKKEI